MAKTPSKKSAKAPKKAGGKGSKKKRTESYRWAVVCCGNPASVRRARGGRVRATTNQPP